MNRKGFTLAEVMGVIILLGLLALITVPAIESYIDNSKEKSYNSTISEIISASKNWNLKNSSKVTWTETATSDIYSYELQLADLKKTEFLTNTDIVDPRTKTDMDGCILILSIDDSYTYTYYEGCEY